MVPVGHIRRNNRLLNQKCLIYIYLSTFIIITTATDMIEQRVLPPKQCEEIKNMAQRFLCLTTRAREAKYQQRRDDVMETEDVDRMGFSTASGSRRVGETCSFNTDCVVGAFCDAQLCRCWSTHVAVERYCWRKVNPEESGCSYNEQCDAVWPGASCTFSICRCPAGKIAAPTREGPVCHSPGQCPTNGANSLLYNRNTNTPSSCFFFDGEEKRAGRFIGCDDFPEVHECIDGLCCPSRALTCIQPMETGDGGNDTTVYAARWYFDSITGSCQQFNYTGNGGNANNFLTKQQCESYCETRCLRGQPQLDYTSSDADHLAALSLTCTINSQCDEDRFSCTKRSALSYCCPKPEFICSEYGGLSGEMVDLKAPPSIQTYSPGSNRQGQHSTTRWYWDRQDRKCKTFKYLGQGGNFNNFLSEQQCLDFCTKALCPHGNPLRLASGANIECVSNTQCPRSHQCVVGVCCPSPATICNQPLAEGAACQPDVMPRFWFNAAQGACQMFSYKGCQGNANNFASLHECQTFCGMIEEEPKCPVGEALRLEDGKFWKCGKRGVTCPSHFECHFDGKNHGCCPTKAFTCRQVGDEGRACTPGLSNRWYYDHKEGKCRAFQFKGCDGNSNNFGSQRDCEDYCGISGCPNGGEILGKSNGSPVDCTADTQICPTTHQCTVLVSATDDGTRKYCCPTRLTICREGFDSGQNCSEAVRRYFFDATLRACRPFTYRGCGGNANNFLTRMACFNFCQSSACATSELVYQSQTSDLPFDCSQRSCPKGYSCVVDTLDRKKKVCCGAPSLGVCPGDQRPFLDHRTQKPMGCSPLQRNSCPIGFFCILNNEKNSYFCCGETTRQSQCPEGSKVVRNEFTQDPLGCSSDAQCPMSQCYQPDQMQTGVCCTNLDNVCPPMFSLDKQRTEESECSPLVSDSCSSEHQSVCLFSEKMQRFVCCKRDDRKVNTLPRCPGDTEQDEEHLTCSQTEPCPHPFFCARQNADKFGICCKHPKPFQVTVPLTFATTTVATVTTTKAQISCGKGERPLVDVRTGAPTQCNGRFPCPAPYTCRPSMQESNVKVCCELMMTTTVRCPNGVVPMSAEGNVLNCRGAKCPNGYECTQDMCCPTKEIVCNEPLFLGTPCEDTNIKPIIRYYFDEETESCRMFEFKGCNPTANHFVEKSSCEKLCTENSASAEKENIALKCPAPFGTPEAPQICSPFFDSCPEEQKCLATENKQYICCMPQVTKPSLRTLISRMCGKGWKPFMSTTGDPRRCDAKLPCDSDSVCKYSEVLMLDICCMRILGTEGEPGSSSDEQFIVKNTPPLSSHLVRTSFGSGFTGRRVRPQMQIPVVTGDPRNTWEFPEDTLAETSPAATPAFLRKFGSRRRAQATTPKPRCKPVYKLGEEIPPYCKNRKYPGESGCGPRAPCSGQSRCIDSTCTCNRGAVLFQRMCYWKCPPFYRNVSGICT